MVEARYCFARRANLPAFFGGISQDHKTLTLAHDEPAVETHTFQRWNGSTFVQSVDHRICHRSRILLQWKGDR